MLSHHLSASGESEGGVPVAKMREFAHASADLIYTDDYSGDGGFFESIHGSLSLVGGAFSNVSIALVDGQYDFDGTPNTEVKLKTLLYRKHQHQFQFSFRVHQLQSPFVPRL